FTIQILTGILLALVYIPSASEAYRSLEFLNYQQELGWFLRAVHYWGSNCMVIVMFFHMTQVFLWGAYKYPRELTWISGVVLLLLTLALSFTGQVMRFDSDAYQRHLVAILRSSCFCLARGGHCSREPPSATGSVERHQRVPNSRSSSSQRNVRQRVRGDDSQGRNA